MNNAHSNSLEPRTLSPKHWPWAPNLKHSTGLKFRALDVGHEPRAPSSKYRASSSICWTCSPKFTPRAPRSNTRPDVLSWSPSYAHIFLLKVTIDLLIISKTGSSGTGIHFTIQPIGHDTAAIKIQVTH